MRPRELSVGSAGTEKRVVAGGLVEFSVILALVFVVAAVALLFFSPQLSFILSLIGAEIERTS